MSYVLLMQGDCLEKLKTVPDSSIHLVIADLPYGNTALKWDKNIDLALLWVELKRVLVKRIKHADGTITKPGVALFFCMTHFKYAVYSSNPEWYRQDLVWEKSKKGGALGCNSKRLTGHESILLFSSHNGTYNPQMRQGKPYRVKGAHQRFQQCAHNDSVKAVETINHGIRYPDTILKYKNSGGGHPTAKPIALIEDLIKTYSNEGDTVLDPTAGGGVVIEACRKWGRKVIAIELDPAYFEMCQHRAVVPVQKELI